MRPLLLIFVFLLNYTVAKGQTGQDIFFNEVTFFLNEKGEPLARAEFEKILKENTSVYHRWDQVENDSIRISRLIPKKATFTVSYPTVFKAIENLSQSLIQGNPVIVIHYNFYNDLCSPPAGFNYWDTLRVRRNKRFSDNLNRRIEKDFPNVIALHLFEPGITIEPSQILKQYFYIDHKKSILNTLFKFPSSCGSVAIVKPGGNVVVFNGETSIPVMADSLKD